MSAKLEPLRWKCQRMLINLFLRRKGLITLGLLAGIFILFMYLVRRKKETLSISPVEDFTIPSVLAKRVVADTANGMTRLCDKVDSCRKIEVADGNDHHHVKEFHKKTDCVPSKKVAFLKTHKCASTSIQNILMRYGMNRNLNFVLPSRGHYLGKVKHYTRDMLKGTLWEKARLHYHIFMLHTKWNAEEVGKTLDDVGDVTYISIVREPVELFRSFWDYLPSSASKGRTLEEFAQSLRIVKPTRPLAGFNQMLRDFGMEAEQTLNEDAVKSVIADIDRTFDLIMIADDVDSFEDSIVLLKRLLCWDFADVVNFKLNSKQTSKKSDLTESGRKLLTDWLWADYLLYDHFKAKFDEAVIKFDRETLNHEKEILRNHVANVRKACIVGEVPSNDLPGKDKPFGSDLVAYELKPASGQKCQYYTMKEVAFVEHLRAIQSKRAREKIDQYSERKMSTIPPSPLRTSVMGIFISHAG